MMASVCCWAAFPHESNTTVRSPSACATAPTVYQPARFPAAALVVIALCDEAMIALQALDLEAPKKLRAPEDFSGALGCLIRLV